MFSINIPKKTKLLKNHHKLNIFSKKWNILVKTDING